MKWARRKKTYPSKLGSEKKGPVMTKEVRKEHDDYIELISDPTPHSLLAAGYQKWYICQSAKEKEIVKGFSDDDKFSYEAFVGGFLAYFEKYDSKKPKKKRTVYFDWTDDPAAPPLTIYLYPVNTPYAYYNKNDKRQKNVGGYVTPKKAQLSPMAAPPGDGQTDPPGVPLPPPPPRRFQDQA